MSLGAGILIAFIVGPIALAALSVYVLHRDSQHLGPILGPPAATTSAAASMWAVRPNIPALRDEDQLVSIPVFLSTSSAFHTVVVPYTITRASASRKALGRAPATRHSQARS